MGLQASDITDSVVIIGSQFSEPMRVVGVESKGLFSLRDLRVRAVG
jgi:hypothetical protein